MPLQQNRPYYLQIADALRERILRGELEPGDALPGESAIAAEWGVARPTARQAVGVLRDEGLVEPRPGSGTYVCERRTQARDRYTRARLTGDSLAPGETSRRTHAELAPVPAVVAAALGIGEGQEAIRRRRVISAEGQPVEVSTSWFRADLADAAPLLLSLERLPETTVAYVEKQTGRKRRGARDTIEAHRIEDADAPELQLEPGSPVLVRYHTVTDTQGEVIEHAVSVSRGDRAVTYAEDYREP